MAWHQPGDHVPPLPPGISGLPGGAARHVHHHEGVHLLGEGGGVQGSQAGLEGRRMEGVRWRLATPIEWPSRVKLAQPRCVTVLL